ncbi:isochorismatase family protein [Calycina marina]|uniref:Isochorismatase family protein n=1 Tax=Calycina marina TaxID=1763456 RepID=A0A9P7ZB03_9HELO|nr:isochorismatase family protein [Calycina marina]
MTTHSNPKNEDDRTPKIIGPPSHFWLWTAKTGFDLTHPSTLTSTPLTPHLALQTSTSPITISPSKTALVIIDMQNFFLSRALRRYGPCHAAEAVLLRTAIPAARKAGIQVIWLNWGISDGELAAMSPTMLRGFGFEYQGERLEVPEPGKVKSMEETWTGRGIGDQMGTLTLEEGGTVDAGRMLMRGQWNTALHPPLQAAYDSSLATALPDVVLHKHRVSGAISSSTGLLPFLENNGKHLKTLLFTGVNTDQCVFGTMQDANLAGWDTVLLKDGCWTNSPEYASQMAVYNGGKCWGFVSSCAQLAYGVEVMNGEMS